MILIQKPIRGAHLIITFKKIPGGKILEIKNYFLQHNM